MLASLGGSSGGHRRRAIASLGLEDRSIAPETPDGAVDAEEELPQELGDRCDALQRTQRAARMVPAEQDCRPGRDEQRPADESEPRHPPRHEPCPVHHVAEDQPVPQADDPAGPQQERPVLDRRERVRDRAFCRARRLLLQGCEPSIATMPTRMNVHSTIRAVT